MKIVSLNVNKFCGLENWNSVNREEVPDKNIPKVIDFIEKYLITEDDVIILQEVAGRKFNITTHKNLKKKLTEKKWKIITEYNFDEDVVTWTSAVAKENSNWGSDNIEFYFANKGKKMGYLNHKVGVCNNGVHVLGLHLLQCQYVWDNIIEYYNKNHDKKLIIIGDMNVDKSAGLRKKLNELMQAGAIDAWVKKGNGADIPTRADGARLDYALMSPKAYDLLDEIEIEPKDITKEEFITDHAAIKLTLHK